MYKSEAENGLVKIFAKYLPGDAGKNAGTSAEDRTRCTILNCDDDRMVAVFWGKTPEGCSDVPVLFVELSPGAVEESIG